jgi:hypothetical protein
MALINTSVGPERVEVIPQPLGTVQVPGAGISTAAFIIRSNFSGAPVNTPTKVRSMSEYSALFGGADDTINDGFYHVQGWFDNAGEGSTAIIVNVVSSPTANDYIGSGSAGTGLRALDSLDDSMMIMVPGLPLATAYLVDSQLISYAETTRADFGSTLSTCFSLQSMPKEITKANTDTQVAGPYTISSITGTTLQFPGATNLAAVTPGMIVKLAGVYKAVVSAVNDTSDTVTVVALNGLVATNSVTFHTPSAITYKESVINNPSKTHAWYFNNVVVTDQSSSALPGATKTVGSVSHVAGIIARIDGQTSIGGPSHAPAGLRFAGIAGIQSLSLSISERLDAEPLRKNFINRLQSFSGSGNVVFGAYTADSGTSPVFTADEQLIQVMRSVQFIKASLEPGLRSFLWENQDPVAQGQVSAAILSFLRNNSYLFPRGLPESQQFKVIAVEPTQNELDQGLMRVRVQIRPNKAIRFIEVALEFPIPAS